MSTEIKQTGPTIAEQSPTWANEVLWPNGPNGPNG